MVAVAGDEQTAAGTAAAVAPQSIHNLQHIKVNVKTMLKKKIFSGEYF